MCAQRRKVVASKRGRSTWWSKRLFTKPNVHCAMDIVLSLLLKIIELHLVSYTYASTWIILACRETINRLSMKRRACSKAENHLLIVSPSDVPMKFYELQFFLDGIQINHLTTILLNIKGRCVVQERKNICRILIYFLCLLQDVL